MDQPVAKTEDRESAVGWGRVAYALMGAVILADGLSLLPDPRGWKNILLGSVLFINGFTYRSVRIDKTTEEALGLAGAVVLLCTMPPLLLVMMWCLDGGVDRNALLLYGGMLLASILGPGYMVWRYFHRRRS